MGILLSKHDQVTKKSNQLRHSFQSLLKSWIINLRISATLFKLQQVYSEMIIFIADFLVYSAKIRNYKNKLI